MLGIALCVGTTTRQHKDCAPSLDRLVPALGYVRGNVRVISHRANRLKGDALIEEIEAVLHYMKEANCL